ncbi:type IV pilin N-terminal domain-containing protein [uncultured Methanospirillum sp.]|uniref:type IV pilin N-terminal domain-containing protein n=1 Tax=uncultured Methanospirillum sp. TaxID=262503 RepID=UPI0029C87595|nr:type IV pilin N-terminal domain-containing protein [uncultured Methanospirillum sp.]
MREEAVSPVIGVLLMLTLTLIIAAIVNSYAGGLMETESKAPSLTLQMSYSIVHGMEIRHVSGDPLPISTVKLMVRPSETFGRNASQYSSHIEKRYITNSDGASWADNITSLRPGEVGYITNKSNEYNLSYLQYDLLDSKYKPYWFNQSTNAGNTFFLEVYYKNTMISRNEVLIEG